MEYKLTEAERLVLLRKHRASQRRTRQKAREAPRGVIAARILGCLWEHGTLNRWRLLSELGLTKAVMDPVLDQLVACGFLAAEPYRARSGPPGTIYRIRE